MSQTRVVVYHPPDQVKRPDRHVHLQWVCLDCGALVGQIDRHVEWHEWLDRILGRPGEGG